MEVERWLENWVSEALLKFGYAPEAVTLPPELFRRLCLESCPSDRYVVRVSLMLAGKRLEVRSGARPPGPAGPEG